MGIRFKTESYPRISGLGSSVVKYKTKLPGAGALAAQARGSELKSPGPTKKARSCFRDAGKLSSSRLLDK